MQTKRIPLLCVVLALGACPLFAASPETNIVLTVNGALAFFNGMDCLSEGGANITYTATFSSTATPVSTGHRGHRVTYKLEPGTVTVTFSSGSIPSFTNKTGWKATFSLRSQTLELSGLGPRIPNVKGSQPVALWLDTVLQKGSWSRAALLKHPRAFSPSPQDLQPASNWFYNEDGRPHCSDGFGITGTASN